MMEYLTNSSGVQHILTYSTQQISFSNYKPTISLTKSNSYVELPRPIKNKGSLTYGNSFLLSDESKKMGLRSSSALGNISVNSSLSNKRRLNSLHYDSINDPHLRDYFEKKFKLSNARKKLFKERKPGPGEIIYKVKVKTGNYNNASTDANVYLTIHGKRGDLPKKQLFNKYNSIRTENGYKFKFERNSTNVFKLIGIDVGQFSHITIEHDGTNIHSSWFLQEILITNTKTHRSWLFECNDWLSRDHGLGKTKIQLFPTRELEKYSQTEYKIITVTGDKPGASTDANVFITLFGSRNKCTERLHLINNTKNLFERGKTDVFKFNTNYVGPIQKVRIEHDNSGKSPGWFLERIVVTDLKDSKVNYYCPCGKWLDKNEEDGLISRDLIATDDLINAKKIGKYKITVFTGDVRNASTDSDVKIVLYGTLGDSGEWKLDNSKNNFERGNIDEFMIDCPSVGEIGKIKIGHNNKGPGSGWFLSKVIIDDVTLNRVYEFVCDRWLAEDEEDGKTTIFLYPTKGSRSGKAASGVPYLINVFTGDRSNAGTNAKVYIELIGGENENESSGRIQLSDGKFERGMVDKLNIDVHKMLSPLSKIIIGHDNSSMSPGWFLKKVEIECPSIGMTQVFPCEKWLAKDEDDGKIERVLKENTSLRKIRKSQSIWYAWVYTSNLKRAGTDSNVFMVLYGDKGKSDDIQLKNDKKDTFESGKCDEFKIETNEIGKPFKLRIYHDNSGSMPGWHLDRIELENMSTKERYQFICNKWLSKDEDDHEIVRELPAEGDSIRKPLPIVKYDVEVHTGDKRGAGTDADVFINIFGELGDTGERYLVNSSKHTNKFERGKIDSFKIEAVTLKQIKKIRIGHNGKGSSAGWFLGKVIIKQEDNPKYDQIFDCNRWLATDEDDGLIVREFNVDGNQFLDTISYNVRVKTGDVRNAGTDANVSLKIFGEKGQSDYRNLNKSDNTTNKFERNRLDEFKIEADDFGKIEKIRIKHDGTGVGSGWFLDYVDVDVPSQGRCYKFSAHRWLDENEGDRKTEIELYPTDVIKSKRLIPYVITIKTADKRNAGTDANVYIQIYGLDGKSEEIKLDNKGNNFEKGKEDVFKIEADDVGPVYKIRIGHDDSGPSSGWFLENLKITRHALRGSKRLKKNSRQSSTVSLDSDLENYYFFVNRWLAKDEDDRQIVREIIATDENGRSLIDLEEINYEVKVYTGDKRGAGTDSNVFLTIYGFNTDSGERELRKSENLNKFERNQIDTFQFKAVDLGEIQKIKIRHDDSGAGSAWYLEKVEILNPSTNKTYLFNCQEWLASDVGDGKTSRELFAIDVDQIKKVKFRAGAKSLKDQYLLETEALTTTYNISIVTSDIRNAGTDANVFIQLFGDKNDSGRITLETSKSNKNKFERGQTDVFEVKEADVGNIRKIRIGHDGRNPGAGWHLKEVLIDAPKLGRKWKFPCGRWLDKNEEDGKIEIDLTPIKMSNEEYVPYVPYEVVVYTSDIRNAETSANPYICIYGDEIHTEQVELCKNKTERKDKFKRNGIDRFVLELDDVGKRIRKIRIGHDNKGFGPGWHVEKVEIRRLKDEGKGSKIYSFPCGRWLARDEDDGAIERDLVAEKIIDEKFENGKYDVREKEARNRLEMKNYVVEVFTGNETGAGTDANVFLNIFGELGDSGEKKLLKSETHSNKFERNQMDRFYVETADLGPLFKVKVRHDNGGIFGSDWYLDRIEIKCDESREKYVFLCDRWLSKRKDDKQIERTLFERNYKGPKMNSSSTLRSNIGSSQVLGSNKNLSLRQNSPYGGRYDEMNDNPGIPYKIKIRTGDEKNCGISSKVYIRLFGENKKQKTDKIQLQLAKRKRFEPSSVETFQIETIDIGNLTQIELGHDGVGPKECWFVSDIEIIDSLHGKTYIVNCNEWLSTEHGDGRTERRFNIDDGTTQITSHRGLIPYNVTIFTGEQPKAGTDCNVTLKFFGTKGSTSDIYIEKMGNRFDIASEDSLMLEMDDVGSLKKVRVTIDGKGSRKEWLLERIEATNMKNRKTYLFVANEWLSKNKLTTDVPLYKDGSETIDTTDYKISIKTSDISGAGTDANVFVTLFGQNGDSNELEMKNSETNINKFERNRVDVFTVKNILSVGDLTKLRIRHDNTGSIIGNTHWHLDYVKVEDLKIGKSFTFNCNKWLSLSKDDKQLVRELTPELNHDDRSSTPRIGERTNYEISVLTADEPNAGTKQNAFIVLIGENNEESKMKLLENTYERKILRRGQEDKFSFKTKSVGQLKKIVLGHIEKQDEPSMSRNASWTCYEVLVKDENTGMTYVFPVRDTLVLNSEPRVYKCKSTKNSLQNITKQLKNVNYEVIVYTGQSGTSSKVSITIFGEYGDTGKRPVKGSFEKDKKDKFIIESLDLGRIKKLIVEHDNSGFKKNWFLKQIEVKDCSSGETLIFPCNKWLSRDKDDGEILRELFPQIDQNELRSSSKSPSRNSKYSNDYEDFDLYSSKDRIHKNRSASPRDRKNKINRFDFNQPEFDRKERYPISRSERDLYYR